MSVTLSLKMLFDIVQIGLNLSNLVHFCVNFSEIGSQTSLN